MIDLLILGGGPAGYVAAERAGQAGLKVVLLKKVLWVVFASMKGVFLQRHYYIVQRFMKMQSMQKIWCFWR